MRVLEAPEIPAQRMMESVEPQRPFPVRRSTVQRLVVDAAGAAAAIVLAARGIPFLAAEEPPAVLFWAVLGAVMSLLAATIPLVRWTEIAAPGLAVQFAVALLWGAPAAALFGLGGGTLSALAAIGGPAGVRIRLPFRQALAGTAAAMAFRAAGGYPHTGIASSLFDLGFDDFPSLLAAMVAMLAVYVGTGLLDAATAEGISFARVARASGLRSLQPLGSYLLLGTVMALVYLSVGPWGPLLAVPALVLTHASLRTLSDLHESHHGAIRALASFLDTRDPYTRGHSERLARYVVRVGRRMGLPERTVEALEVAARLHDLGKVAIDPRVLAKPDDLTPEERAAMRGHVEAGARVMSQLPYLAQHADMVRCHHERPDGRGYPLGLLGEEIPLGARVLKVLDAYDAMTSDRPYRRALSVETALAELQRATGTEFDAGVVEAVVDLARRGELDPARERETDAARPSWR